MVAKLDIMINVSNLRNHFHTYASDSNMSRSNEMAADGGSEEIMEIDNGHSGAPVVNVSIFKCLKWG